MFTTPKTKLFASADTRKPLADVRPVKLDFRDKKPISIFKK